jgi:hypothetical protein
VSCSTKAREIPSFYSSDWMRVTTPSFFDEFVVWDEGVAAKERVEGA